MMIDEYSQVVADVGNSDPDSTEELDDELGNLREINSKYRVFRDTNASDRMETASVSRIRGLPHDMTNYYQS